VIGPDPLIFLAAALLLAGVLLSKTSSRLGVPSLLLFLGLGMLPGVRDLAVPRRRHHASAAATAQLASGNNDPAAVFLTVGMIALVQQTGTGVFQLGGLFVVQMSLGLAAGWLMARGAVAGWK
jgi:NhaP-type Na+/H+ and K+/H+ antiporter